MKEESPLLALCSLENHSTVVCVAVLQKVSNYSPLETQLLTGLMENTYPLAALRGDLYLSSPQPTGEGCD